MDREATAADRDLAAAAALAAGRLDDPFAYLGPHETEAGLVVRAFLPEASRVEVPLATAAARACSRVARASRVKVSGGPEYPRRNEATQSACRVEATGTV